MGQYYNLINLDKRQFFYILGFRAPNAGYDTFKFSTLFGGAKMWEKLMNRGEKPLLAMALAHLSFHAAATTEGDVKVEAVKNSMTPMGSWSGDRNVIIGDYSEGFPPFFTSQDQQDYKVYAAEVAKVAGENGQASDEDEREVFRLHSYASDTYTAIPASDFFKIDNLEDQLKAQFPKQHATHHLILNLDKKEYLDPIVCKSPTQEKQEGVGAIAIYVEEFAQQKDGIMQGLLSLLFFSNGSGGGDVGRFKEGRWAGNRISIRVKETVEDLAEWKNISAEVEADLNSTSLRTEQ